VREPYTASQQNGWGDVAFGSKADIEALPPDVRFTLNSGHCSAQSWCLLCAKSGHWPLVLL